MKTLKLIPLLFLIHLYGVVLGQTEDVFDRLHGEVIKEALYVKFDGVDFRYETDNGNIFPSLTNKTLFLFKNEKQRPKVIVFCGFLNPLKYSLTSSVSEVDDPVFSTVAKFFETKMEPGTAGLAQNEGIRNLTSSVSAAGARSVSPVYESIPLPRTLLLAQWIYEFKYVTKEKANRDSIKNLAATLEQIVKVDNLLYGKIKLGTLNGEKSLSDWIGGEGDNLYNAEDYNKFVKALGTANQVKTLLVEYLSNAKTSVEKLRLLFNEEFDRNFKPVLESTSVETFKDYSAATSSWLKIITSPEFKSIQSMIDKYQQKLDMFNKYVAKFDSTNGFTRTGEPAFNASSTKMSNFKISVTPKDVNGIENPKETKEIEFTIAKYERFVPFISAGIVTSNFSYQNFGVEESNGVISAVTLGETKIKTRPAIFLNLLTNINSRILYPFIQVGLANGEGYPIVPVGAGLIIRKYLTVSAGSVFGQRLELPDDLDTKPITDEANLQSRLVENWHSAFYFSITVKFASLTK